MENLIKKIESLRHYRKSCKIKVYRRKWMDNTKIWKKR